MPSDLRQAYTFKCTIVSDGSIFTVNEDVKRPTIIISVDISSLHQNTKSSN